MLEACIDWCVVWCVLVSRLVCEGLVHRLMCTYVTNYAAIFNVSKVQCYLSLKYMNLTPQMRQKIILD